MCCNVLFTVYCYCRYMTACVGNCLYLAPEIFAGDKYTESAGTFTDKNPKM